MSRVSAWLRRRVLWTDLSRDWRMRSRRDFPADIKDDWSSGGKLILRRKDYPSHGTALDYYYDDSKYAVQLDAQLAKGITDKKDWRIQFSQRNVKITDIHFRSDPTTTTGPVTAIFTVDLASARATTLAADAITASPIYPPAPPTREDLRALHNEVAAAWRQLTDVRFKLLALIPVISGLGLFSLLDNDGSIASSPTWARAGAAAFGFLITIGLYVYDRRNSQLYDDLISRGKHLEHALGFTSGVFLGRLKTTSPINHSTALRVIYLTTIVAWLIVFGAIISGQLDPDEPPTSDPAGEPAGEPTEAPTP